MNGKCLECGEDFVGRSDKKFCCDLCRTSYYNKIYRNKNANMAEVNRILSRNRHFLAGNYAKGITKIPLGHLVGKFSLDYCTAVKVSHFNSHTFSCYEYDYTISGNNLSILSKRGM